MRGVFKKPQSLVWLTVMFLLSIYFETDRLRGSVISRMSDLCMRDRGFDLGKLLTPQ